MSKEEKILKKSTLEKLWESGIPLKYVRFHQPVPPYTNKEPVAEFKVMSKDKYSVEEMRWSDQCILFMMNNELDIVPHANVIYSRPL